MSSEPASGEEGPLPFDAKWLYLGFYALIGLWLVYLLANMEGWRWEDYTMPLIAGIPGVLLVLVYLFRIGFPDQYARINPVLQGDDQEEDESLDDLVEEFGDAAEIEYERPPRERLRVEIVMIAWVVVLPVVVQYLGIFVALPLYVFSFSLYFTGKVTRSLAITVVFTLFIYVFFVSILGASVYTGELGIELPLPRFRLV